MRRLEKSAALTAQACWLLKEIRILRCETRRVLLMSRSTSYQRSPESHEGIFSPIDELWCVYYTRSKPPLVSILHTSRFKGFENEVDEDQLRWNQNRRRHTRNRRSAKSEKISQTPHPLEALIGVGLALKVPSLPTSNSIDFCWWRRLLKEIIVDLEISDTHVCTFGRLRTVKKLSDDLIMTGLYGSAKGIEPTPSVFLSTLSGRLGWVTTNITSQ